MRSMTLVFWVILMSLNCKKSEIFVTQTPNFYFENIATLPEILKESSGIETGSNGKFWSLNDANGKPELYLFDSFGLLQHTIKIPNADNVDWEDMAQDDDGNLFIGDFGNNENDRKDLKIYKIELGLSNNVISMETIHFNFPNQTAFPPTKSEMCFDTEAMFVQGDCIYLLTKDRSDPFNGKTTLYSVPDTAGSYDAEMLSEFFTYTNRKKGQITSADISPDGTILALLTNETVYFFKNFPGVGFFSGQLERNDLPIKRQMESIVFSDDCTLYLTNEKTSNEAPMLYKISICK